MFINVSFESFSIGNQNAHFYHKSCRAAAFTEIGKFNEAINDCREAIKINPRYAMAFYRLGYAYYEQGKNLDAIREGFVKGSSLLLPHIHFLFITHNIIHIRQFCTNKKHPYQNESMSLSKFYFNSRPCLKEILHAPHQPHSTITITKYLYDFIFAYDIVLQLEPHNQAAKVCLWVCLFNF